MNKHNITIRGYEYILTPLFRPYLTNYQYRYNIFYGGAGSGKSHNITQILIRKALYYPNRKTLVLRKVARTLRTSCFSLFVEILLEHFPQLVKQINKSNMTITLVNDSQFIFMGLDDSEKVKSIVGIADIFLEEANQFFKDDLDQLNLRIRTLAEYSQIYLLFNPVSRQNWIYERFFNEDIEKELREKGTYTDPTKSLFIHKSTYRDNPILPKSYIDEINRLEERNPNYYNVYANGEFGTLGRLIYCNWRIGTQEEIEEATNQLPSCRGLDFGYNDPTAYIKGHYDRRNKTIYITDEFKQKGLLNTDIGSFLSSHGVKKYVDEVICDNEDTKAIEELKRAGYKVKAAKKGRNSVLAGIKFLLEHEIVVHPSCSELVKELENYEWMFIEKINSYIDEPKENQDDHLCDAMRYMVEDYMRNSRAGAYNTLARTPYIVK